MKKQYALAITCIILVAWLVFSCIYIASDIWGDFKREEMAQAYSQGRADAIAQVIDGAKVCKSFNVVSGDKQIELIAVNCLQSNTAAQPQQNTQQK
ncbi:MAG: hypothetical protein GY864_01200 [Desulfobacterales bacterium]|nr:hypothetical protein [Desulfobacterales bacterium]